VRRGEALAFLAAVLLAGLAGGLYFRAPFDDEIHTLLAIDELGVWRAIVTGFDGGDIHPPLSTAVFAVLSSLGLGPALLRVVATLFSALAFLAALDVVLRHVQQRRWLVIVLFAACPLLFGVGDSLRWYPLFTLLTALFLRRVLLDGRPSIGVGVLLGLAGMTSFLAVVPALAYGLHRYGWQRRFEGRRDVPFLATVVVLALPSLWALLRVVDSIGAVRDAGPIPAALSLAYGYFAGGRLGPSFVAAVAPLAVASSVAVFVTIRGLRIASPLEQVAVLLVGLAALILPLIGNAQPRSLLFVAPWVCVVLVLSTDRFGRFASIARVFLLLAASVPTVLVLVTLRGTEHPFKRNLAIPYEEAIDWTLAQVPIGAIAYVSEPVIEYGLRKRGVCVVGRIRVDAGCELTGRPVVIVRDQTFGRIEYLVEGAARSTSGRPLTAQHDFGVDRDAGLKNRLTGSALTTWIVRIEIWRH
jgi:hypothetical protein